MSAVRYLILTSEKKDSLVSVVSEVKQCSEPGQIFHFNSSEVKLCSERSQGFPFNSSEAKQRNERSQMFHFNSGESKAA